MRVGGQIINEFVDDYGALGADSQVLVSLGEGPLEQICGQTDSTVAPLSTVGSSIIPPGVLFLNDSDAAFLDDVQAQVRMGTINQAPVEGFEFASASVAVDSILAGPTTTAASSQAVINYNDPTKLEDNTSSNSTWTQFGITYSAGASNLAEGAVVKILLPEGASYTNDNGEQSPIWTGVAVRYIELDGTGSAITTGGPDLDGYVRLRPFRYYKKYAPGIAYDIRFPLYDPQTFTRPGLCSYLDFNAGGELSVTSTIGPSIDVGDPYLSRTGLTVPTTGPEWTTSGSCESFTVEMFFYARSIAALSGFATSLPGAYIIDSVTGGTWLSFQGGARSVHDNP